MSKLSEASVMLGMLQMCLLIVRVQHDTVLLLQDYNAVMQTSGGGTGRRESAPALLAGYENLLVYLKSQGALLNAVKPELLLDIADFRFPAFFTPAVVILHAEDMQAKCHVLGVCVSSWETLFSHTVTALTWQQTRYMSS